MGIYSHYSDSELSAMRDALMRSLHDRLTKPTAVGHGDRNARFDQQTAEIRKEVAEVNAEIDNRAGANIRRPIYLV